MLRSYFLLFAVVLFLSCSKEKQPPQIPPQNINVVELKPQTVPIIYEFVGEIYGEKDIPIRARVEGYLEEIHFEEGGRVKRGDLLYVIDSSPFQQEVAAAQSAVTEAETHLVNKENDLQRIEPLAELDAVSGRDLDNARAARDAAQSSLKAAKANLKLAQINLGYCRIHAPIDGVIGKTLAREGEFVGRDPNPVILNTVSDLSDFRVQFFLSELEYLRVSREYMNSDETKRMSRSENNVKVQLILADGSLYEHNGKVDFVDRNVNPTTGAILIQASFPNPRDFIRPGQFARIKIEVREDNDAIIVPQSSVSELQGQYSVFVVDAENKVASKTIELGEKFESSYIVRSGLEGGEKVIIEGIQKVRTGMAVVPQIVSADQSTNKQ